MKIGIAGAGLMGRLTAWTLAHQGHEVHVFDPADGPAPSFDGRGAAGFTAAGMLSPTAERETAELDVAERGWQSIERWAGIAARLDGVADKLDTGAPPLFTQQGSLLVAHGADAGAARRVLARIADIESGSHPSQDDEALRAARVPRALTAQALQTIEPALHSACGPLHAWLLPDEAHIDTVRTMVRLQQDAPGVNWHWDTSVVDLQPGRLSLRDKSPSARLSFDWVFDTRGVGAKDACPVRGVRGEMVWLHAPGVRLQRPVRLLHPRHRVYIVPRPGDVILVGASEVESEDRSPMSLRSAVELMAAAHSVLPDLAEARILRLDVNLRPALPDHRPQCHVEAGLVRLNGLYRHGWLLAPSLLDEALAQARLTA